MANIEWLEAPSDAALAPLASVLSGFWREVIAGEPDFAPAELATEVRELPSHRRVALAVASERANPVGVAELVGDSVEGRQRLAWLRYLVVVAGRRQRGLGRALLDAAIARCRAEGRSRLTGTVPLDHAPGMAFAQASGA